jgi:hypothetical protein
MRPRDPGSDPLRDGPGVERLTRGAPRRPSVLRDESDRGRLHVLARAAAARFQGSVTVMVVPPWGGQCTWMSPPCRETTRSAIASPSPDPRVFVL